MPDFSLTLDSAEIVNQYKDVNRLQLHELEIFDEILKTIESKEEEKLLYYCSFGDSLRAIAMNLHAHRRGLIYGFESIQFDNYGWLCRPNWLDQEELTFGDISRYGNYSIIQLGHGPNQLWTYALSYSFGCAGGGWGLSVYDSPYPSREDALRAGILDLKNRMRSRIGSSDTSNDKQPIIIATLRDIEKAEIGMVQLSLFN